MDIGKIVGNLDGKRTRANKTLSLDLENYESLVEICEERGWKVSAVFDELLKEFLQGYEPKNKRKR